MRDFVVVGAGFFGATFARRAADRGKSVVVFDAKPHIAGAAHDKLVGDLLVHQYGAHIFHTDSEEVWQFVNRFGDWFPFVNKPKVRSGRHVYSFPINMMTLHQMWGVITPAEAYAKLKAVCIPCENPRNFEEWALSKIGPDLYYKFIYGYTKKQYMKEPSELPASIIRRLPIRLTYEESYFHTKYQAMPEAGYSAIVANMLDGIEVHTDAKVLTDWRKYGHSVVFTGCIDEYFGYTYGKLDYNSLKFEHRVFNGDQQGNAVVNWTDQSVPQLRTVEYRHFARMGKLKHYGVPDSDQSVVTYDIPTRDGEPLYPIRDGQNSELYARYAKLARVSELFGGRLGEYQYYDIDQTIASALRKADAACM